MFRAEVTMCDNVVDLRPYTLAYPTSNLVGNLQHDLNNVVTQNNAYIKFYLDWYRPKSCNTTHKDKRESSHFINNKLIIYETTNLRTFTGLHLSR